MSGRPPLYAPRRSRLVNESDRLIGQAYNDKGMNALRNVCMGVLVVALVVGAALGIAAFIMILSHTNDGGISKSVKVGPDHGSVPAQGDVWTVRGGDLTNRAYNAKSKINSGNAATLVEKFKAKIGQDPSLGGTIAGAFRADINWGSVVVDDNMIYLATHFQRNLAGAVLDSTGYFMAFDRNTGVRVWNKAVTSYSLDSAVAQAGSKFEAAPAVHGNFLYIGTKNNRPQSYASPPFQSITNPRFFGFPAVGKARRTHVYCIDKLTGNEVWATEIGAVATHFAEPDNLLFITTSPIVFEMDPSGGNNKIPIVAVGTSSGNSFVPDFSGSDETDAKGYGAISGGVFGLGTDPNTRFTDMGRVVLLNGNTGAIISTTMMGPTPYKAGDVLLQESVVYGDNSLGDMEIWHIVQAADIAGAGELNPIGPRYGKSKMIISIMPGATIAAGSPLVGLVVQDNLGAQHQIAAGAAPANLDYVTVTMEVEFQPGTTKFQRLDPQPLDTLYDTTTSDLDGALGNVPARIVKNLKVGDVLTDQDAYEASHYGASVWGSTFSINYNKDGIPTELYCATGQAHKIPYDTVKRFSVTNPPGSFAAPQERLFNSQQKQNAFTALKTPERLEAVRKAVDDRLKDLQTGRELAVSVRDREFRHNSVVAINLRPGHVGEIIWSKKVVDYDTWRIGMLNDAQRDNTALGPLKGFTDVEAHYGTLRGHDGDHGEAPQFCPNCGEDGQDIIIAPNKGGTAVVLELSDLNDGPTTATERAIRVLNHPGLLGGSNYGSSSGLQGGNGPWRTFVLESNDAGFGGNKDKPFGKRSLPPELEWFPVNENDPTTIVPFTNRQSYLVSYNFLNNSVDWEMPLLTTLPDSQYGSVCSFSGGADLIYIQPNKLEFQIRKNTDGSLVHTIPTDSAGVSNAIVLENEIFLASGRQGFLGDNPAGTNYKAAQYIYKWGLP